MSLTLHATVFSRLTLRWSFFSMKLVMLSLTRSAALGVLQKITQSSAYRTNGWPRFSNSLSSSLRTILLRSGLSGPPWGVPTLLSCTMPLTITPAFRYLCINDITLPSLIVKDSRRNRKLWFTVSKNFSKSRSTQYVYP